ncbi:MAG: hypothetical protein JKX85_07540 [Phycisphaeraceae bacterium]|nr:hypothetical protein [Phycisphaeraceae bacterium]
MPDIFSEQVRLLASFSITVVVRLAFSLLLMFGARGLAGLLLRVRTLGLKKTD